MDPVRCGTEDDLDNLNKTEMSILFSPAGLRHHLLNDCTPCHDRVREIRQACKVIDENGEDREV